MIPSEHDALIDKSTTHEHSPQQHISHWRWFVLLVFSLLSFSSALMWDTFAPCLYIFVDYYFGSVTPVTVNAINAMSLVYMLLYPFAVQPTLHYFEDSKGAGTGLKRGVMIGASLNALGAAIRWLGRSPDRFMVLSVGQVVAAFGQVFILSIPPKLAGDWFPENEANLATAIGVSANNLGVAAGCIWSPMAIMPDTMQEDIPWLLLLQFLLAALILMLTWLAFQRKPDVQRLIPHDARRDDDEPSHDNDDSGGGSMLWRQPSFYYMLASYGVIMGVQCSVITLLAQILMPPFQDTIDESFVGWLGFIMLVIGFPASCIIGHYLDQTLRYRLVSNFLTACMALSGIGLYASIEFDSLIGVAVSCIVLGITTSAITPVLFQYASELYYPINENTPAGYLLSAGNIGGVLLVTVLGWSEDMSRRFSMKIPMLFLVAVLFITVVFMAMIKGPLKRTLATTQYLTSLPA
ncbi:feline leukemia virus subgroup c receptor-related protein 2-like [Lichtheimia corymbifera JMRC:FSU:9682]|uniref:Feline leukemia virus subgroup c receptor-related protein 2-like n=1 Tax=Lichtheimia corymbifera JMRC:FSU:9682 TaxID=1263082 RepID=A0A068RJN0_9FUNG|nr:feline leukemia virus subgroup c receptor-related protein 2-like [Lichtheimia corymbifera JMRC:FSU:9682]